MRQAFSHAAKEGARQAIPHTSREGSKVNSDEAGQIYGGGGAALTRNDLLEVEIPNRPMGSKHYPLKELSKSIKNVNDPSTRPQTVKSMKNEKMCDLMPCGVEDCIV